MTKATARKTSAKKAPASRGKGAARPAAKKTGSAKKKRGKSSKSKTNLILIGIIAVIVIVVAGISLYGILYDDPSKTRLNLYFVNNQTGELQIESRRVSVSDNKINTLTNLLEDEYIGRGPRSSALKKSVPNSVTIEMVKIIEGSGGLVEVYFDESYLLLSLTDELNCRAGLVMTLTELDFVERVSFFVGGEELLRSNGQPFGELSRENVRLDSNFSSNKAEQQSVKLYFSDAQGMGLVLEKREIAADLGAREKSVLLELFKGSATGLVNVLAADTKIKSVIIEDGTCIVDFSADFLSKIESGATNERLAIYSIVNTLCDLSGINSVQILIDGVKVSNGQIDISAPFEKNEDIILEP